MTDAVLLRRHRYSFDTWLMSYSYNKLVYQFCQRQGVIEKLLDE